MSGVGTGPVTEVLVICEANRARSPVLAQLLRQEAERRGLADQVTVTDAGLRGMTGEPLLPSVLRAVRGWGLGLEEHRAVLWDPGAPDPGLVLTMTEDQRHVLLRARPHLLGRTFTVKEAVRLLESPRWDTRWEGGAQLPAQLHRLRPLVPAPREREDVADPARGGRRLAAAVVAELRRCSPRIAQALWGPVTGAGRGPGTPGQTSTAGR